MSTLVSLFTVMLACGSSEDTGDPTLPPPWEVLSVQTPSPFRQIVNTEIEGAVDANDLLFFRRHSLVFVRDEAANRVHILDARYRHSGGVYCLPVGAFPEEERFAYQQESCAEGEVSLHRGFLQAESPIVAMSADSERSEIHFLTQNGLLYKLNVDLLEVSSFDYLRLPQESVSLGRSFTDHTNIRIAGNWVWAASGNTLTAYDRLSGEERVHHDLPGNHIDMEFLNGSALVATDQGLWQTDGLWEESLVATDLYRDANSRIWAVYPSEEKIVNLDEGTTIEILGLTGPIAGKSRAAGLWALAGDEVVVADETGVVSRFPVEDVIDIEGAAKVELTVLHSDGSVSAYFDETQLVGGPPLSFVMASFVERPKSPAEDEPCTGGESNVEGHVELAAKNLSFLKDLPAPVALGVTPHLARRARQCELEERLSRTLQSDIFEVGVLIHQAVETTCAEDPDCYAEFIAANVEVVESYGAGMAWASGMASHFESGADWVLGLVNSGVTDRFLFFGLSILAHVEHDADPRSKEVYPIESRDQSSPWTIRSAATSTELVAVAFGLGQFRA